MSKDPQRLHLFQGYGVELEYMIVESDQLDVRPFSDRLLVDEKGEVAEDVERGETAWSNELVGHVIELKSNGPKSDLVKLHQQFAADIREINLKLKPHGAKLLPTAMHPWMDPMKETSLWSHGYNEIYQLYDEIFNCKGHGWSNLQSVHINLPFYDDEEFGRLHTAIRFLLPLIPMITASSPIMEGKDSGFTDARLDTYETNQARIPVLTGKVIPELVFSKYNYHKKIYERIEEAIAPFNKNGILKPVWLNSRGAISRFDRGAIEIRIIDIQECPKADLAIVALLTNLLKLLVREELVSFEKQKQFETVDLYKIYRQSIKQGTKTVVKDLNYLSALGFTSSMEGQAIWKELVGRVYDRFPSEMEYWKQEIDLILNEGNLAERIQKAVSGDYSQANLHKVYSRLASALQDDTSFQS